MLINTLIIAGLLGLGLFLGWTALKALRIQRAVLKWPAAILAGLLSLVVFIISGVTLFGFYRLTFPPYRYVSQDMPVKYTPDQVQRGEKLAYICIDCHSSNMQLPLDGGNVNMLAGDLPFGDLYAPNLTPGGPMKDWSDSEIMRAIREGIDHQGRPLIVMPSQALHQLSDADASALIAYMRSQPAVKHDLPQRNLTVLAALFIGGGMFPTSAQTPILEPVIAPEIGSLEYGAYLISSLGCTDCHGLDLAGKPAGAGPGGPNLTVIGPNWKEEDFIALFREGRDPTGRQVSQTAMPWKSYSQALSDEELKNAYRYLNSLQRIEETNR